MGKEYFKRCCEAEGLPCDELFFLGTTKKIQFKRYSHRFSHFSRKPSHQFVVLYVEDRDFYIVWSLRAPKAQGKDVFSVSAEKIGVMTHNEEQSVHKSIEYSGWNEETVWAFGKDRIADFIHNYAMKERET